MSASKISTAADTIAVLALALAVAVPVASSASAAPVLGTPISLPADSLPTSVAFSPDGSKAYVANYDVSTVLVITFSSEITSVPRTLRAGTTTAESVALSWSTWAHTPATARARKVTGLTPDTRYQFKVAAKTATGTSPYTAAVSKTTLAR